MISGIAEYDQLDSRGQLQFISIEGVPIYHGSPAVRNAIYQMIKFQVHLITPSSDKILNILGKAFELLYVPDSKHMYTLSAVW
jgi:hypothetical protein